MGLWRKIMPAFGAELFCFNGPFGQGPDLKLTKACWVIEGDCPKGALKRLSLGSAHHTSTLKPHKTAPQGKRDDAVFRAAFAGGDQGGGFVTLPGSALAEGVLHIDGQGQFGTKGMAIVDAGCAERF